jgi:diguanylate cyclase (GGDEF)-like protein
MSQGLAKSPRFWRAALAAVIVLAGTIGTVWFFRVLQAAEHQSVDRHIDSLAGYVESDIRSGVLNLIRTQFRLASRLSRSTLDGIDNWQYEVDQLRRHYPYHLGFAVLDLDRSITHISAAPVLGLAPGDAFPVGEEYVAALEALPEQGGILVTRPWRLDNGPYVVNFLFPLVAEDNGPFGYMAALLSVPEAAEAMVADVFHGGLVMRLSSRGEAIYVYPPVEPDERFVWRSGFELDLDGDGDGFVFEFSITEAGRRSLQSALPQVALFAGVSLSLLLAIVVYLALSARAQARTLTLSNRKLEREIRDRELAEREMEFLVTHDPLTGLPNRTGSTRYLERVLDERDRDEQLALLFLDLDQFKDINDSLGHQLGDQLLCEVPRRLAGVLKDRDFVGRHGGDEFLIAVQRSSREQVEQLAGNLLRAMDSGFLIGDHRFFISASIGIAYFPESGETISELIQNADTALFKAKNSGRNQFVVFTREMFNQAQHRLNLSRDIRHALDEGRFRVVYQPIVSLRDLSLCGLEALLRWEHEKGYMVPPQEFIRVAEETGVIGRLGQFALEQALKDLAHWKTLTRNPPWLAVNISGVQVREAGFAENLSVLLHRFRIEPELLHLEITEEVLIENLVRNRRTLQKLDEIGMRIVVDDFGVGYSSLAYLKNFPISVVKIDRGFISDLARDPEDQAITRTICSLASDLGMLTVAEGVEESAQLELLRGFDCSYAQGFLFSRPVPADEVSEMLSVAPAWQKQPEDS